MLEDDGTNPFGSPSDGGTAVIEPADWDTPEWHAEMEAKYGDARDKLPAIARTC
jgi:hypothetical protein